MTNYLHPILFICLFICSNIYAGVQIYTRDNFVLGEKAFVAVSDINEYGSNLVDGTYSLKIKPTNGSDLSWMEEVLPDRTNNGNDYWSWWNRQDNWLEAAGYPHNTGTYTGIIEVYKNKVFLSSREFTLNVLDHATTGFGLLYRDTAAAYPRQIEINTKIKNFNNRRVSISRPYFDYFLNKGQDNVPVIDVWNLPNDPIPSCVEVYVCDDNENNFIVRHRYLGDLDLPANGESGEFQIGYRHNPDGDFEGDFPEKNYSLFTSKNNEVDPSYIAAFGYESQAVMRNAFYNNKMALYEKNGNLLFGSVPNWNFSSCRLATHGKKYNGVDFISRDSDQKNFCDSYDNSNTDVIYEGEDYIYIPDYTDMGADAKVELVSAPSWIEIGTPSNYDVDNWPHVLKYQNVTYVRSKNQDIRQKDVIETGDYYYTLRFTSTNGDSRVERRRIVVKDGREYSLSGVVKNGFAVLMGDETWFRKYQMDIATGIVNYSNKTKDLKNFYYDYYGTYESRSNYIHSKEWYLNNDFEIQKYDCGENRFRIRHKYNGSFTFFYDRSNFDNKYGIVYRTGVRFDKNDDYSYVSDDVIRRRTYAPNVLLYDGDGTKLWGTQEPSWSKECKLVEEKESDIPSASSSDSQQTDENQSSSVPISSSSEVSKELFAKFGSLKVLFANSTNAKENLNFKTLIQNTSDYDLSLAGFEIRFYYQNEKNSDVSHARYEKYYNGGVEFSATTERCSANEYALKIKLDDKAFISPKSTYPQNGAISHALVSDYPYIFDKTTFASWIDYSTPVANENMALFDANGNIVFGYEKWECDNPYVEQEPKIEVYEQTSYAYKTVNSATFKLGNVSLEIRNISNVDLEGDYLVNYYTTHPSGQVAGLDYNNILVTSSGDLVTLENQNLYALKQSTGNKNVFTFLVKGGLKGGQKKTLNFTLYDGCLYDCHGNGIAQSYSWNFDDDWSHDVPDYSLQKTNHVTVYNNKDELLVGEADVSAPSIAIKLQKIEEEVTLNADMLQKPIQHPNRTDAITFAMGQLLSNGDFEDETLRGWNVEGNVKSIRGTAPQGSRFVRILANGKISQDLPSISQQMFIDSGAVLSFMHRGDDFSIDLNGKTVSCKNEASYGSWRRKNCSIGKPSGYIFINKLSIATTSQVDFDDMVLTLSSKPSIENYAVRFTTTQHEEIESRAFDGAGEMLVTASERDYMGRPLKKYLPYAMKCSDGVICNPSYSSATNPANANKYYTSDNPNYPDAQGVAYTETSWKPDQATTKDAEGAPGVAFSLSSGNLVKSFSSGINLTNVDLMNFDQLSDAVSININNQKRIYDSKENFSASIDSDPTHLWEMSVDQDGRKSFTVKDGEGRIVIAGALDENGKLLTRSISEYDERGFLIKSHPPKSCDYNDMNENNGCVSPSTYVYDAEGRIIESNEPDANHTRTFYDIMGRVCATQTQRQITNHSATVSVYDNLGRVEYSGEWKFEESKNEDDLRKYFLQKDFKIPEGALTKGTIARNYYDEMPNRLTLGVELYPSYVKPSDFKYTKTFLMASVSDVKIDEATKTVVRRSVANKYDKYGRVLESYIYDGNVNEPSLRFVISRNEYDLGGKVVRVTKLPYGVTNDDSRSIKERYAYDRLGRVEKIFVQKGDGEEHVLASYEYYPIGNVKSIKMGDNITLTYTYHISGAVKTAVYSGKYYDNKSSSSSIVGTLPSGGNVKTENEGTIYSETLFYEDCGSDDCSAQYNGNVSRMVHYLAHSNGNYLRNRDVNYFYDLVFNRLNQVDEKFSDEFDEMFSYDEQGRIVSQARGVNLDKLSGAEYNYITHSNKLLTVTPGGGSELDKRFPVASYEQFKYDADGNLIADLSKKLSIAYDWRGMPVEFKREKNDEGDSVRLVMAYDGGGSRILKQRELKAHGQSDWIVDNTTHYSGIGTELRVDKDFNKKVVVNMPQGMGRYGIEELECSGETCQRKQGTTNVALDEFYLKNHLGSTVAVMDNGAVSTLKAAYDYRAFGEQVDLEQKGDKVTENFTGKEKDDETELNYFGARYLDPMLGLWISVDAARQYQNPYLYAGNNPVMRIDPDGNQDANAIMNDVKNQVIGMFMIQTVKPQMETVNETVWNGTLKTLEAEAQVAKYALEATSVVYPAAKPAVIALDVIDGATKNGLRGAGYALFFDLGLSLVGKKLPDNKISNAAQTIFGECLGNEIQDNISNENLIIRTFDQKLIEYPEVPLDNTEVR